mmetsp:Transcript_16096/g.27188  ORF Transcript_16096/g.27188 Transcript_16096/m.27188 type:complete len:338 (-) Transcript_16096:581-1594(-)
MSTAKQQHCVIQPQIIPNLLEHAQRRDVDANNIDFVFGALLGNIDGKILNISNSFPVSLKIQEKSEIKKEIAQTEEQKAEARADKEPQYVFDPDYIKKMIQFHKRVNSHEAMVGIYVSSPVIDKTTMVIFQYFRDLFKSKEIRTQLNIPVMLTFDPSLNNNRLDIKMLSLHSIAYTNCPFFSQMPFKFNLENIEKSGLDVLFYGQEHYDTMAILNKRKPIEQDKFAKQLEEQKLLSNRPLLLRNFRELIENLEECEKYVSDVLAGKQNKDVVIGNVLNRSMSQFTQEDLAVLEQMVLQNFSDAVMTNNLSKLQSAQITLTQRINNIFSQQLNNYILQ